MFYGKNHELNKIKTISFDIDSDLNDKFAEKGELLGSF